MVDSHVGLVPPILCVFELLGPTAPAGAATEWHSRQHLPVSIQRGAALGLVAFTAGTSKRSLAERYGISESNVKRLIRQHGASKPSGGL